MTGIELISPSSKTNSGKKPFFHHSFFSHILPCFCIAVVFLQPLTVFSISGTVHQGTGDDWIFVDDDNVVGPWYGTYEFPFQYIADALSFASDGNQIFVMNGTYCEQLIINKTLILFGESAENVVLHVGGMGTGISILADFVCLQNLTVYNFGADPIDSGILIQANNTIIRSCIMYHGRTAITAISATRLTIEYCTIHNTGFGVFCNNSADVTISNCTYAYTALAIKLHATSMSMITSSFFHTNGRAIFINDSTQVIISTCNLSDNSVNHGGIFIQNSTQITIHDSIFHHNGIGVGISTSQSITLTQNTFRFSTHIAVLIEHHSSAITIASCTIKNSLRFGIYVVDNSHCRITSCNLQDSLLYAVYTKHSEVQAQSNYWGSLFGPALTAFTNRERITPPLSGFQVIPWKLLPVRNASATWTNHPSYLNTPTVDETQTCIQLPGADSDDDMVPDWWETKWGYAPDTWDDHQHLDPDNDGLNNIEECYTDSWDSNPFIKDIFIEIDWMPSNDTEQSNKPTPESISQAVNAFQHHNISLHIDIGDLGGGEQLPYIRKSTFSQVVDMYWDYFLHANMSNPRKGIFRYGIICDDGPDVNFPFFGWNNLDCFFIAAQVLVDKLPQYTKKQILIGGIIHHTGHTLGLLADTYEGIDNFGTLTPLSLPWFRYHQYVSSMNYMYKYTVLSYSDGTHGNGDFDDWSALNYTFFKNSSFQHL